MKDSDVKCVPAAEPDDETTLDSDRVECICPKCGRKHTLNFVWTGRGVPRKFCPQCKPC